MIPMVLYLALVPLGVMLLAKRWAWIEKVSPMTVLYAIGLAVGNSGLLHKGSPALALNATVGELAIAVAIPLMLMGCNLKQWSTGKATKAFLSGLLAVVAATLAGFFLFRNATTASLSQRDYAQVCAVATGIYTGGIPNMGAIKQGVGMGQELYLCVTAYDLIVTSLYLLFIIFLGKRVFRALLPLRPKTPQQPLLTAANPSLEKASLVDKDNTSSGEASQGKSTSEETPLEETSLGEASVGEASRGQGIAIPWLPMALAAATVALSYVAARVGGELNMSVFILLLTTLSIAASFLPPIRRQSQSFPLGLYFVNVFALSIATSCNIAELNLLGNLGILAYIAFVVFGSVALQIVLARLLRLDGDTVMVTSVALINSPPFVPLAAALLRNREVVLVGIFVGLLGYMLGNYLGIGIYHLLMLMGG